MEDSDTVRQVSSKEGVEWGKLKKEGKNSFFFFLSFDSLMTAPFVRLPTAITGNQRLRIRIRCGDF